MIVGIDIGGTATKLGIFTKDGELIEKWSIPTEVGDTGENIIPNAAKSVMDKLKERNIEASEVAGIGFGVPCPITKDGFISGSANLKWNSRQHLTAQLKHLTGIECVGGNDANLAALGEAWKGAARGCDNVVMVTLGTGVGGGIICNGHLLFGEHGMAGEIGHLHIADDMQEKCGCGGYGCLEQYSSATGIVRMASEMLAAYEGETALTKDDLSAKSVFDAYKAGDKLAADVVDRFACCLGKSLANLSMVVDPEVFVIGGGVSAAGEVLLEPVIKYYKQTVYFKLCDNNRFVIATLGNDAGIYGAARLAMDRFCKN